VTLCSILGIAQVELVSSTMDHDKAFVSGIQTPK
jgi:hypothetical protein